MTRDEAIEIEKKKLKSIPNDSAWLPRIAAANIDALIELGLLKVDGPFDKCLAELARSLKWSYDGLKDKLDTLGFKVTLK